MEKIINIAQGLKDLGIKSYFVGGYVRDKIMGKESNDIDIVLVGNCDRSFIQTTLDFMVSTGTLESVTMDVGKFPVWIAKVGEHEIEFAMARVERKTGDYRTDFDCITEGVTLEQDLLRRDLTINAIAQDILTEEIIDPHGGIYDIAGQVLRHVSEAFSEDTLRVYRLARFASYFPNFSIAQETHDLCRTLFPDISAERVGIELMKVMKNAVEPSRFFYILVRLGWLNYHFPELQNLIGVPQSPTHHPEGDAFVHTMHCLDAANGWFLRIVMLCHDLGKAVTTEIDGHPYKSALYETAKLRLGQPVKISAIDHEKEGVPLTRTMLQRIHLCDHATIRQIATLVELHMVRAYIKDKEKTIQKVVRRFLRVLLEKGLTYMDLAKVVYCDLAGRPPLPPVALEQVYVEIGGNLADALIANDEMTPIVTGDILIKEGLKQGQRLGEIKKAALKYQDRGTLRKDNWRQVLRGAGFKEIKIT